MEDDTVGVVAAVGLVILLLWAAWEDVRKREISGEVLVGVTAAALACTGFSLAGLPYALTWLLVGWVSGMGGGDAKVLAALSLCCPSLAIAAFLGMAGWYALYRWRRHKKSVPVLPGAAVVAGIWLVVKFFA